MDKKILVQYCEMKEEIKDLRKRIQKLYKFLENPPVVADIVKGTRKDGTIGPIKSTGIPEPEYVRKQGVRERYRKMLELKEAEPPKYLYHGTASRFLPAIQAEGIRKMSRQYVHLSGDFETAMAVGRRHGIPVVVTIDAAAMARDGVSFYRAENGVWLCGHVEPKYFVG